MATRDTVEVREIPNTGRPAMSGVRPPSEAYRSEAGHYDTRTDAFRYWRELLIDRLPAASGDTVFDIGCGTGLCLPLLHEKVGPAGTIVGIDESVQMLDLAAGRVAEHGWENVSLHAAAVDAAPLQHTADAVVFCAVHDVMQSRTALAHIFSHVRPGAAVAAIGGKWPSRWLWPYRAWVADLHEPFITDFSGFDEPWRVLAEFVPDLDVLPLVFGGGYLAVGHTPMRP